MQTFNFNYKKDFYKFKLKWVLNNPNNTINQVVKFCQTRRMKSNQGRKKTRETKSMDTCWLPLFSPSSRHHQI